MADGKDIELRFSAGGRAPTIRQAEGDDDKRIIEGYGALFDVETELFDGYYEVISRGAFDEVLKTADVRCLFNHDINQILGRSAQSGTLTVEADDVGLRYVCELPKTASGESVYAAIQRKDVTQSSFSFRVGKRTFDERGENNYLCTIERVDELFDVGPVAFAAYPETTVAARALDEWRSARGNPPNPNPAPESRTRIAELERRVATLEGELDEARRAAQATKARFAEYRDAVKRERAALNRQPEESDDG